MYKTSNNLVHHNCMDINESDVDQSVSIPAHFDQYPSNIFNEQYGMRPS